MVDLAQALGISFRNFCKSYKSFFKKWLSKVKKTNKDSNHGHDRDRDRDRDRNNDTNNPSSKDHPKVKRGRSQSLRNGRRSVEDENDDPESIRTRSYDRRFSSLSGNASRRRQDQPLSSVSGPLFRSTESGQYRVNSVRRSMEYSTPSSPRLSKSSSRRSTTPIMFSNSSGVLKPAPVEKQLECTLEELCFGCMKKIKVTRDVLSSTGQATEEEETLTIKVTPGWKKGTKITFEGMRSEVPGSYPADMSFVIAEKHHSFFKREGDDLELTLEIPLLKALTGCTISVPLLGGETMSLEINDVVSPGYEKIIEGQGMPKLPYNRDEKRGDLRVKFLVEFPTELTVQQRSDVCRILEDSDYSN